MSVAIKHLLYPVPALPVRATAPCAFGDGDDDASTEIDNDDDPDTDDAQQAEVAAAAAEAEAIERQARAQGWRPEAEFKGEGKWVDAKSFVERGTQHKKKLEAQVASLTARLAEQDKVNKQFAEFTKAAMARKDAELADAIKAAKLQRSEAIRNGDDDDALALDDRIETLQEEKAKLKEEPAPAKKEPAAAATDSADGEDPEAVAARQAVLNDWIADGNEWFRDNPRMRAYALTIGQEYREAGDASVDRKFLDKIKAQMALDMPEKFGKATGNPLRLKAGAVEAGGPASQQATGKTERDLPKQDRNLMNKFVADGLMTKEQFLKDYDWS